MKKRRFSSLILILAGIFIVPNSVYAVKKNLKLDKKRSTIEWLGKKVTGEHSGTINFNDGSLVVNSDDIVSGNFSVDMTSIVCTDITNDGYRAKLERHLKSDDFFGVENHPESKFEITDARKVENGNYKVKGNITIKGITQTIELVVSMHTHGDRTHVSGIMIIDRTKFNVRYGSGSFFDNLGDKTIYDDFELQLNLYLE